MQIQRVTRVDGVEEKYVREAGATPRLRPSRVGSAALVAPASLYAHTKRGTKQVHNAVLNYIKSGPEPVLDLDRSKYRS